MCFSASASFIAGGALSAVGVATLKKTKKKSEIPFAAIPFLFGIQQITEGIVWISLQQNFVVLSKISSFLFSLFAYPFWPVFLPFTALLLENHPVRRRVMTFLFLLGIGVSLYLAYYIIRYPVTGEIVGHSIHYVEAIPYGPTLFWFYVLSGGGSCLVSSHTLVRVFGFLLIASIGVAYYFYALTFISVWCFLAAVLSLIIYLFFKGQKVKKTMR